MGDGVSRSNDPACFVGDLAVCQHGKIGLITSKQKGLCIGINIRTGGKWQSQDPKRIGDAAWLLERVGE